MSSAEPPSASLFSPSGRPYRYAVLFFASLLTFGSYFAYDSVSVLAGPLMRALHATQEDIGLAYSIYSIAAIFSVLLGGIITDRIGTKRASLLFSLLVTLGAVIVALADNLPMLHLGRLVFGWGSESLVVAQNAILARWFRGKELAFSFGVSLSLARLGTLFSLNTEALIAEHAGFRVALFAAAALCGVSLVGNLIYNLMDRYAERRIGLEEEGGGERIALSDLKTFPRAYYHVVGLCVTFYSAIFAFTALSTDFFAQKWGMPMTASGGGGFFAKTFENTRHMFSTAPGTSSIIMFASMVFAPIAGTLVDRLGRRAQLMLIGSVVMVPCFLLLGLSNMQPAGPMIALGAAFVLVPSALWPMVPLLVPKERVGTAYGLMTMLQNVGMALFPWLNGKLRVVTNNYESSMVMFALLGCVGCLFAGMLYRSERKALPLGASVGLAEPSKNQGALLEVA